MQATLTLSPFLTQKLNKLGSDLYGANGQQNTPRTTADFIERLKSIFACKPSSGVHLSLVFQLDTLLKVTAKRLQVITIRTGITIVNRLLLCSVSG